MAPLLVDSRARSPRHWRPPRCGTAVLSQPWRSRPWSSRGRHLVQTQNHPTRHPSYLLRSVGRQTAAADPSLPTLGWRSRAHHHQHHLPLGRTAPPLHQRKFTADQHQRWFQPCHWTSSRPPAWLPAGPIPENPRLQLLPSVLHGDGVCVCGGGGGYVLLRRVFARCRIIISGQPL